MENVLPHNVLIISNKPPYPIVDGGCFAMSKFEQLMRKVAQKVYYFSISTPKHPLKEEALPEYWTLHQNYFNSYIDTKVKPKHVGGFLVGNSLRAKRFYQAETATTIVQLIKEKNIQAVIFESIYAAVYLNDIKKHTSVNTFIRSHNIEHQIWEQYADNKTGLKKTVLLAENKRLKTLEDELLSNTTGNIFISDADAEYYHSLTKKNNYTIVATQLNNNTQTSQTPALPLRLFHIGAMDWLPNLEGVENFIQHMFPAIINHHDKVELHLAGKSMPAYFDQYASNQIKIHGEVKNATDFMNQYDVLIVPILSGSGIRIKILEAMALGKPVITTPIGIEGIPATHQQNILLANTTSEWIEAIEYLKIPGNYQHISSNGLKLIEQNYSENVLLEKLTNFIRSQLN